MNISIWPIEETLTGTTTLGLSRPGSNDNEGYYTFPQSSRTEASPSDSLVIYPGHSLGMGSYSSAEMLTGLKDKFILKLEFFIYKQKIAIESHLHSLTMKIQKNIHILINLNIAEWEKKIWRKGCFSRLILLSLPGDKSKRLFFLYVEKQKQNDRRK